MGVTETGKKKGEKSPRGNLPHCGKKPNNAINLLCSSIQVEINFSTTTGGLIDKSNKEKIKPQLSFNRGSRASLPPVQYIRWVEGISPTTWAPRVLILTALAVLAAALPTVFNNLCLSNCNNMSVTTSESYTFIQTLQHIQLLLSPLRQLCKHGCLTLFMNI